MILRSGVGRLRRLSYVACRTKRFPDSVIPSVRPRRCGFPPRPGLHGQNAEEYTTSGGAMEAFRVVFARRTRPHNDFSLPPLFIKSGALTHHATTRNAVFPKTTFYKIWFSLAVVFMKSAECLRFEVRCSVSRRSAAHPSQNTSPRQRPESEYPTQIRPSAAERIFNAPIAPLAQAAP